MVSAAAKNVSLAVLGRVGLMKAGCRLQRSLLSLRLKGGLRYVRIWRMWIRRRMWIWRRIHRFHSYNFHHSMFIRFRWIWIWRRIWRRIWRLRLWA